MLTKEVKKRFFQVINALFNKQSWTALILIRWKYFFINEVIACETLRKFEIQKYHINVTPSLNSITGEKLPDCTPTI